MMGKNTGLLKVYLLVGVLVCGWFTIAAANGWKAVNLGILDGSSSSSSGRGYGGSWGGGK